MKEINNNNSIHSHTTLSPQLSSISLLGFTSKFNNIVNNNNSRHINLYQLIKIVIGDIYLRSKIFQYVKDIHRQLSPERQKYFRWGSLSFRTIVYFGYIDLLNQMDTELITHNLRLKYDQVGYFSDLAASKGHTEILKLFYNLSTKRDTFPSIFSGVEIKYASTYGRFETMKYIYQHLKQFKAKRGAISAALCSAALHGHFNIVEYIYHQLIANYNNEDIESQFDNINNNISSNSNSISNDNSNSKRNIKDNFSIEQDNDSFMESFKFDTSNINSNDNGNNVYKRRKTDDYQINSKLSKTLKLAMESAIIGGNIEILELLAKDREKELDGSMLVIASSNSRIDILKWLVGKGINRCKSHVLDDPAKNGKLEIIQWLYSNIQMYDQVNIVRILENAVKSNHYHIVMWLLDNNKINQVSRTFTQALARDGKLDLLKRLFDLSYSKFTEKMMDEAAYNGHLDVIKWLHENRIVGCTSDAIDNAAKNGHLEVIKWLHENRTEGCSQIAIANAARRGNLEIVKYLHEKLDKRCTSTSLEEAAYHGHLNVVVYISASENDVQNWQYVLRTAVKGGYLDTVQYISKNNILPFKIPLNDKAAKHGRLEVVKWIHLNRTEGFSKKALSLAAAKQHYDIVQFLCENRPELSAMEAACYVAGHGDIPMLDYILKRVGPNYKEIKTSNPFDFAAIKGNLDVIKYLFTVKPSLPCPSSSVDTASVAGHFDIVRYLIEKHNIEPTTDCMDFAAANGYIEIIEWLHRHSKVGCTEAALYKAAKHNCLEVVKFLIENRTEGNIQTAIEQSQRKSQDNDVYKYLKEYIKNQK